MIIDGSPDAARTFVFAHGAGGPMDSPFMTIVARGLAERGIRVVRFEFPYMAARRAGGKRGAPDREPLLLQAWRDVVAELGGGGGVAIGGKSLGGRIASMVADELRVRALLCFGYPFHPPGQPEKLRTKHLERLATPALIIQGERDSFGTPDQVRSYPLSTSIKLEWLTDGDHSFKPRVRSGATERDNLARAIELAAR